MNIFLVHGDVVHTPPVSSGILEGITRNSVMELLTAEGVEIREIEIARGSLYVADEVFLTGTAAEVTPVREIDDRQVGTGKPGPITSLAQTRFAEVVGGKDPDYSHWLTHA